MAWYRCGGGGLPAGLQSDMDTVLNKKFSTSTTYPPTDWPDTVNLMGPLPEKTASSASICSFSDGADDVPMASVIAHIAPTLTGVNAVNMVQTGKNFIDFPNNLTTGTSGGISFSKASNGGISYSGTATGTFAYITPKIDFKIPSGKQFTLSRDTALSFRHYVQLTFSDDTTASVVIDVNNTSVTYTPAKDVIAVRLIMSQLTAQTAYSGTVYIQIEYNSSATTFEAYNGEQYTANLGRTVYGADVDLVSGECEPTNWLDTSTFSDLSYYTVNADGSITVNSSDSRSWSSISADIFLKAGTYTLSRTLTGSQCYIRSSLDNYASNVCSLGNSATSNSFTLASDAYIKIKVGYNGTYPFTDTYQVEKGTTVSAYSPYFAPFTIDGQEIPSLLGVNNLWHDAGETECTYRADISLALQALGGGGRGLMMMRPTEQEETEETEGLEDELNR